eukprot:TRINITY_DN1168_c1_g1_i1.p1 TRINITY_DN1168_c1_g1~~TRINITY_DN1168_c1_g1_i1.p1  ORF type:complete len:276 (+),score=70.20 TRINITY_DN1168_c1_g1_i1:374-1201(+)
MPSPLSRDLDGAQDAFLKGDAEQSRLAHDGAGGGNDEDASQEMYIKTAAYGGIRGAVSSLTIVAGAVGAKFTIGVVLVIGFFNLVSLALALGFGDYSRRKSEDTNVRQERERESWEFDNYLEGEQREMIELYENKGMTSCDAEAIVMAFSKYKEPFVDLMVTEELGLLPLKDDDMWSPIKHSAITSSTFILASLIPLAFYCIAGSISGMSVRVGLDVTFGLAFIMTFMILMALGSINGRFTHIPWWRSGVEACSFALVGGLAAFFVARLLGALWL